MAQQQSQQHGDVPIGRGDPYRKQPPLHPPTSLWASLDSPVDAPLGINLLDGGVLCVVVLHLRVAQLGAVDADEDGGAAGGVPGGRPAPDLAGASPGAEMQNLSALGQEGGTADPGWPMLPMSHLPLTLLKLQSGPREKGGKKRKKKSRK